MHVPPRAGRFVNAQDELQGLAPLATVRSGSGDSTQDRDDVLVVGVVPGPVYGERIGRGLQSLRCAVVVVVFGKVPMLDTIDCRPANLDSSPLTDDGDRSFQIAWVGQHRHFDGT